MSLLRGPAVLECTRGGDSRAPTVALVENSSNGAAHHRDDELMG